jgi:hypothetical protein
VVDRSVLDPAFRLGRRGRDASFTYDGCLIVSERFRSVADGLGAVFRELPSEPGYFAMFVTDEVVAFDVEARRVRMLHWCGVCERFTQVAGATPVYLRQWRVLPDRFVATDVCFGSCDGQDTMVLIGPGLGAQLKAAKLKGLELEPIVERDPLPE